MHCSAYHPTTPGAMSKAAETQAAKAAAARHAPRARRVGSGSGFVRVALLLLAAAPAHAAATTLGQHRHGRDSDPVARALRGNQTTAPPQERPAVETLQARADAWLANQSRALAAHGPLAAWDTSGETTLASVFQGAAGFNEDLNAYVWRTAVLQGGGRGKGEGLHGRRGGGLRASSPRKHRAQQAHRQVRRGTVPRAGVVADAVGRRRAF